ncbi:hypothetical protein D3C71_1312020 [compost metagenome]
MPSWYSDSLDGSTQLLLSKLKRGSALARSASSADCDCERAKSLRSARLRSRTCTSTPYSQLGMLSIHRPGGKRSLEM